VAYQRVCFELPGEMAFFGDPEVLLQIWSTIGYTTQVAANMDQSISLLLAGLTQEPAEPGRNTTRAIQRATGLVDEQSYGTDEFRRFATSALATFAAFQGRRSRFVHDQVLPAAAAAVRVQPVEGRVEHREEPLDGLIEQANEVMVLTARLNGFLIDSRTGGVSAYPEAPAN
jgi:hypothetical protein